jgi:hypothetical protein
VSRWHDRLDVAERALAKPSGGRVPRDFGDLTCERFGPLATEVRASQAKLWRLVIPAALRPRAGIFRLFA